MTKKEATTYLDGLVGKLGPAMQRTLREAGAVDPVIILSLACTDENGDGVIVSTYTKGAEMKVALMLESLVTACIDDGPSGDTLQ